MTAAGVGHDARDSVKQGIVATEEFDRHQCAGDRRVGGSGEHRHEAESGEEVRGGADERGQRVAEGRADEEERRHLPALEPEAEGDRREDEFPAPAPRSRTVGLKRRNDCHRLRVGRRDAQAEIIPRAHQVHHRDDQASPQHGLHDRTGKVPRARDVPPAESLQPVGQGGEQPAGRPEQASRHDCTRQKPPVLAVEAAIGGGGKDGGDEVVGVGDAPGPARLVADDGSHHAGDDRAVPHAADGEHLQREDRAGQGSAKDPAEAGGDAGHQDGGQIAPLEPGDDSGQATRQAASHLDGGALATGRPSAEVRGHRADQDQRGHPQRHASAGIVDFVDDQVVPSLDRLPHRPVEPADASSGDRQKPEQSGMIHAGVGGCLQAHEEQGNRRTHDHSQRHGDHQPADHRREGSPGVAQAGSERHHHGLLWQASSRPRRPRGSPGRSAAGCVPGIEAWSRRRPPGRPMAGGLSIPRHAPAPL